MLKNDNAYIILAGDLNTLDINKLSELTGLTSIVKQPTRGENFLDRLLTSLPIYSNIKVVSSVIKTDHKAIIASTSSNIINLNKSKIKKTFRKRTPDQHANLLINLEDYDPQHLLCLDNPKEAWKQFYHDSLSYLDKFYPERTIIRLL